MDNPQLFKIHINDKTYNNILNDLKKVNFAIKNKLNFIVIPYWEFDKIEKIIDCILNNSTTIEIFDILIIRNGTIIKEFDESRVKYEKYKYLKEIALKELREDIV